MIIKHKIRVDGLLPAIALAILAAPSIAAPPAATQPAGGRPAATAPAEPLELRVFQLKHAKPSAVVNALTTLFGSEIHRVSPSGESSVVVGAKKSSMPNVEQLVNKLDIAPENPRDVHTIVVALKHARAIELAPVLQKAIREPLSCTPWSASNSLVLTGEKSDLDKAMNLIQQLDVGPVPDEPLVRTYPLAHAHLTNTTVDALTMALGDKGSLVADRERGLVVVKARSAGLKAVEEVLKAIDQPWEQPEPAPARLRVRFLWLINGLPEDKTAPLPPDVAGLAADLEKIGISGLRLAAQSVVEATSKGEFKLSASPTLTNPCDLKLDGQILDGTGGQPRVHLTIKAIEHAPYAEPYKNGYQVFETKDLCSLDTTAVTPLGRAVVAGVTPVGKMTAVFILQVSAQ